MRTILLAAVVLSLAPGVSAADKKTRRPGMNRWNDQAPGSTKPLPRPYPGAPAIVPHAVEERAITRDANSCLDCHLEGADMGDGHVATKVPPSHFVNPKTKEARTGAEVGTRYQCLQCHATTTR